MAIRKHARTPATATLSAVALTKLASSGLDADDAALLKLRSLEVAETVALTGLAHETRPGLLIPYFNPLNGAPLTCGPRAPFWRLRYLGDPTRGEFGEQKKERRYTQSNATGVCAYFPTNVPDWAALVADVSTPLLITEGELKAAAACKFGFPCIGLGGVFNFASKEYDIAFLAELEAVNWLGRAVYIVYDSDLQTNALVLLALNRLARQLQQRGAQVFAVFLPAVVDGKTGLDDYLLATNAATTDSAELRQLLQLASPLTADAVLHELNETNIFIYESAGIYNERTGAIQTTRGFEDAYASLLYETRTLKQTKDGPELERRQVPAAKAWVRWPLRRAAGKIIYEPGQPRGVVDHESGFPELRTFNVWPGPRYEPIEGDIEPFMTLIDHVFKDVEPSVRQWFLQWCAWPLIHPGTKLYTAVILYGRLHGTGKSLLGETIGALYGDGFTMIGNEELNGKYNGWSARKQFILGDEITGSNKRELSDRIKRMITQTKVRVDNKYEKAYELRDCTNFIFTSNHGNSFVIEDDDRRLFVHEMPSDCVLDEEDFFKAEYEPWFASSVGRSALLWYLTTQVDLAGFNPNGRAPMTVAKKQMNYHSKSDLASWAQELRETNGRSVPGAADLYTNSELLAVYQSSGELGRDRVSAIGLGNALRDAGFEMANKGEPIRGPHGVGRYYVIRNADLWRHASYEQLSAHLRDPKAAVGNVATTSAARKRKY